MFTIHKHKQPELFLYAKSALTITRNKNIVIEADAVHVSKRDTFASLKLKNPHDIPPGKYEANISGSLELILKPCDFNPYHTMVSILSDVGDWGSQSMAYHTPAKLNVEICRASDMLLTNNQLKPYKERCLGHPVTFLWNKLEKAVVIISGPVTIAAFEPMPSKDKLITGIPINEWDKIHKLAEYEGTSANQFIKRLISNGLKSYGAAGQS